MQPCCRDAGLLLGKKVLDWTQETGLIPSVRVSVEGRIYNLHKLPLIQKCRYFKFHLLSSPDAIELPPSFPGGCSAFEWIGLFVYRSPLPLTPSSVAALRCAAEFLGMTESCALGNLCERADLYLNQVVLQSWDDTLTVLCSCQPLLPLSDKLLIVGRCVESIAFMACMEILDPEHSRDDLALALQALASRPWSSRFAAELAEQVPWIRDLITLPLEFFKRIIDSLRRQGMRENHISPIVVFYTNRWLLSEEGDGSVAKALLVLRGTIDLLLEGTESSYCPIPVGFYFALLAKAVGFRLRDKSKAKLQNQIASLLHLARFDDLLLLGDIDEKAEVEAMERIILIYMSKEEQNGEGSGEFANSVERAAVAELWDRYLSHTAASLEMSPGRFEHLIRLVPIKDRRRHDHLYKAVDTFFLNHPHISVEDKSSICKLLNCQKLSQEACAEAVRNDRMPIRLTIQVLYAQQLSNHRAFRDCTDSFRHTCSHEFLTSFSDPRQKLTKEEGEPSPPDSLILKDLAAGMSKISRDEYESARMRIETLQDELDSLKENLESQEVHSGSGSSVSGKGQRIGEIAAVRRKRARMRARSRGCFATLAWVSRRRCAGKLVRMLRRMSMLGIRRRSKEKQAGCSL